MDYQIPEKKYSPIYFLIAILVLTSAGAYLFLQLENILQEKNHTSTQITYDEPLRRFMGTASLDNLRLADAKNRMKTLPYVMKGNIKEFHLTAEPIRWEYAKGKTIAAWGFNGQVPGPEIRVTEGDNVRIIFTNNLPVATTIHWHSVQVPFNQDGVPGINQKPIQPGETYTYEFEAQEKGTRFYHAHGSMHGDEAMQVDMGLSGAFIIEPKEFKKPDRDIVLILDDWHIMGTGPNKVNGALLEEHGMASIKESASEYELTDGGYNLYTINGLAYPDTEPIMVKKGDNVRVRFINVSNATIHPMHLHGHAMDIIATDGSDIPKAAKKFTIPVSPDSVEEPIEKYTLPLLPGETYDVEFVADNPGVWMFHCHMLHHSTLGMMTLLQYEGYSPVGEGTSTPFH